MNDTLVKFNDAYLLTPFGLYNNSIICYFNSLLQALFGCTSINEYLLNNQKKFINNNFIKLYINILKNYILINNTKEQSIYSVEQSNLILFNEFLILLKNKNLHFGYNQEDSGELLLLLLDIINDEYIYNLFYHKYKCDIYCKSCKNIVNIKDDISVQFEIDNKSINSKFLKSNLNKNLNNLNKYIRNNYSECTDYICQKCKKNNSCIKINRLLLTPTVIVLNFNKYAEKSLYNYPLELFFINTDKNKKFNYKLISSIHHSGNNNFGHYVTKSIRKVVENNDIQNNIYLLNDTSYQTDSFKPDKDSYILFYHYVDSIDYFE